MGNLLRHILKSHLPEPLLRAYGTLIAPARRRRNRRLSAEAVFSEIYEHNRWGGQPGEIFSGPGSTPRYIDPYCDWLSGWLDGFHGNLTVVDLGCGDFSVGRALLDRTGGRMRYVGMDVVQQVIRHHNEWLARQDRFDPRMLRFVHGDIVEDPLPEGDVCLLRQVLQHLSNQQIARILPKLRAYRYVVFTEHYPGDGEECIPNLDKAHGPDVRLERNSAVCLDKPPFALLGLRQVLSLKDAEQGRYLTFVTKGIDIPLSADPGRSVVTQSQ